eukprot:g56975.t1
MERALAPPGTREIWDLEFHLLDFVSFYFSFRRVLPLQETPKLFFAKCEALAGTGVWWVTLVWPGMGLLAWLLWLALQVRAAGVTSFPGPAQVAPRAARTTPEATRVVLIHLKAQPERLTEILSLAQQLDLLHNWQVQNAIHGNELGEEGLRRYAEEKLGINPTSFVLPGAITGNACALAGTLLSHATALLEFLQSNDTYALVLEDDLYPAKGVDDALRALRAVRELDPQSFDLLYLERLFLRSFDLLGYGRFLSLRAQRVPDAVHHIFGTGAILYSRKAAETALKYIRRFPDRPIDILLSTMLADPECALVARMADPPVFRQHFFKYNSENRPNEHSIQILLHRARYDELKDEEQVFLDWSLAADYCRHVLAQSEDRDQISRLLGVLNMTIDFATRNVPQGIALSRVVKRLQIDDLRRALHIKLDYLSEYKSLLSNPWKYMAEDLNRRFDFDVKEVPHNASVAIQDTGILTHTTSYTGFPAPVKNLKDLRSTKLDRAREAGLKEHEVVWSLSVINRGTSRLHGTLPFFQNVWTKKGEEDTINFMFTVQGLEQVLCGTAGDSYSMERSLRGCGCMVNAAPGSAFSHAYPWKDWNATSSRFLRRGIHNWGVCQPDGYYWCDRVDPAFFASAINGSCIPPAYNVSLSAEASRRCGTSSCAYRPEQGVELLRRYEELQTALQAGLLEHTHPLPPGAWLGAPRLYSFYKWIDIAVPYWDFLQHISALLVPHSASGESPRARVKRQDSTEAAERVAEMLSGHLGRHIPVLSVDVNALADPIGLIGPGPDLAHVPLKAASPHRPQEAARGLGGTEAAPARPWRAPTRIVVLTPQRDAARLAGFQRLARQLGLLDQLRVQWAVDASQLGEQGLRQYAADRLNITAGLEFDQPQLATTTCGHALSHLTALQEFLSSKEDFLLLLEDDVHAGYGLHDALRALQEAGQLQDDPAHSFDLLWLSFAHVRSTQLVGPGRFKSARRQEGALPGSSSPGVQGTGAMLYSRAGAQQVIAAASSNPSRSMDNITAEALHATSLRVGLAVPSVFQQDRFKHRGSTRAIETQLETLLEQGPWAVTATEYAHALDLLRQLAAEQGWSRLAAKALGGIYAQLLRKQPQELALLLDRINGLGLTPWQQAAVLEWAVAALGAEQSSQSHAHDASQEASTLGRCDDTEEVPGCEQGGSEQSATVHARQMLEAATADLAAVFSPSFFAQFVASDGSAAESTADRLTALCFCPRSAPSVSSAAAFAMLMSEDASPCLDPSPSSLCSFSPWTGRRTEVLLPEAQAALHSVMLKWRRAHQPAESAP